MIRSNSAPAVAYYRMSTDRQEASIPAQRDAVEKYAKANGYTITAEYIDEGISGDATEKRVQFQRMVVDAERRSFKAILCWDIDRFGRFDSIEAGHWIYPLRKCGVHLATVAQGEIDWGDFAGRVLYGIQQEAKNQYLTDLSRNVTRGMMRKAEQGDWTSGKPAIGYVCRDKRLCLGPESDVALVRRIFADYLAGKSLRGIAAALLSEGIISPKHKPWTANGIASVLRNRMYTGDFTWNRTSCSKYKRKGRPTKLNPPADWIVIEDHHPAIVSRQDYDRVQQQLRDRKHASTPHKGGGGFLLTGLLVCGKCGHRMAGDLSNKVHQYCCYGYRERGPQYCDRNGLRQADILEAILAVIGREYFNPDTMARLAAECRRQIQAKDAKPGNPGRLRAELDGVDAKLAKAKQRLVEVDDDLVDVVQDQIRDLRAKRDSLTAAIKATGRSRGSSGDAIDRRVAEALAWFGKLQEAAKRSQPELVRQFLREAVERVEVRTEKLRWTERRYKYRLAGGTIFLKGENLLTAVGHC